LVKATDSGRFEASVLGLPACRAEAASRELALATLKTTLLQQVEGAEALVWQLPVNNVEKPPAWLTFAGIFKDNTDFAEIVEEIQAARNAGGDEAMDESEYRR